MHAAAVLTRRVIDLIYPPRCVNCRELTDSPHGLCPACWRETHFIAGPVCDRCGMPVPGGLSQTRTLTCDECTVFPPAWDKGRAALLYEGSGRQMVLALKHADRLDLGRPLAAWMARSGAEVLARADLIVPVPLHWLRLAKRRYNQSAELARALGRVSGLPVVPDLLLRSRQTGTQDGKTRAERAANMAGALALHPARAGRARGARILLIDDVMTTGATLSAAAEALRAGGAASVDALVAARVARGP